MAAHDGPRKRQLRRLQRSRRPSCIPPSTIAPSSQTRSMLTAMAVWGDLLRQLHPRDRRAVTTLTRLYIQRYPTQRRCQLRTPLRPLPQHSLLRPPWLGVHNLPLALLIPPHDPAQPTLSMLHPDRFKPHKHHKQHRRPSRRSRRTRPGYRPRVGTAQRHGRAMHVLRLGLVVLQFLLQRRRDAIPLPPPGKGRRADIPAARRPKHTFLCAREIRPRLPTTSTAARRRRHLRPLFGH